MFKFGICVLASVLLFASAPGCTRKSSEEQGGAKVLNLAVWSNYVSPELIEQFTRETGIAVKVSNYSSNEELLAKLQAGASGYDVAVPSDYMVFAMRELGLLTELDRAQLPSIKTLNPKFLKKEFDPENRFSFPYNWGSTGIAVNRTLFKGKIEGFKDLFTNPELAGKFTLLDDSRETIGAALKALGYSLNSVKEDELAKAKALLIAAKPRVKAFTSEPMVPLVNGETAVAHAYMSDALLSGRKTGGKIEYIIPSEGGTLFIDNLVIPAGALHLKEAHAFINFLLTPKNAAATVQHLLVAPASLEAYALLPSEIQKNPLIFPSEKVLSRLEMMHDLGEGLAAWDRIWTEVKAGQ